MSDNEGCIQSRGIRVGNTQEEAGQNVLVKILVMCSCQNDDVEEDYMNVHRRELLAKFDT